MLHCPCSGLVRIELVLYRLRLLLYPSRSVLKACCLPQFSFADIFCFDVQIAAELICGRLCAVLVIVIATCPMHVCLTPLLMHFCDCACLVVQPLQTAIPPAVRAFVNKARDLMEEVIGTLAAQQCQELSDLQSEICDECSAQVRRVARPIDLC